MNLTLFLECVSVVYYSITWETLFEILPPTLENVEPLPSDSILMTCVRRCRIWSMSSSQNWSATLSSSMMAPYAPFLSNSSMSFLLSCICCCSHNNNTVSPTLQPRTCNIIWHSDVVRPSPWTVSSPGLQPTCKHNRPPLPSPLFLMSTTPLYYATHPFTTLQKCLLQPPQISIIITTLMLTDQ